MPWIKVYKRFGTDMKCRDQQYHEGLNENPEWENPVMCERGTHACENPLDCSIYYDPAHSVIRECELDATEETSEDSKRVGRAIKIGAELDVMGLCKAHFEYVTSRCDPVAGRVGGDREAVSVGEKASAAAGESGSAAAGNWGSAAAGYKGSAAAGNWGSAAAGESGSAVSRGSSAVGENGLACARGNGVKVRGGMGAVLVIAEENKYNYDIAAWKAAVVDGVTIKPDTWYKLEGGEFREVDADET